MMAQCAEAIQALGLRSDNNRVHPQGLETSTIRGHCLLGVVAIRLHASVNFVIGLTPGSGATNEQVINKLRPATDAGAAAGPKSGEP